jgi:hypothetical protein
VNIAMGRSHAWVKRGEEYVEPRPMNWGDNLTLIGAMRADRWLTLGMCWRGVSYESFETWVRTRLAPRLRRGDIVLLDNLNAHKSPTVRQLIEARGATVRFLPPCSHVQPDRTRVGFDQEAHPQTRAPNGPRPAPSRARRSLHRPTASLPSIFRSRWVRQLKRAMGLKCFLSSEVYRAIRALTAMSPSHVCRHCGVVRFIGAASRDRQ